MDGKAQSHDNEGEQGVAEGHPLFGEAVGRQGADEDGQDHRDHRGQQAVEQIFEEGDGRRIEGPHQIGPVIHGGVLHEEPGREQEQLLIRLEGRHRHVEKRQGHKHGQHRHAEIQRDFPRRYHQHMGAAQPDAQTFLHHDSHLLYSFSLRACMTMRLMAKVSTNSTTAMADAYPISKRMNAKS